jgi:hypothetical protein
MQLRTIMSLLFLAALGATHGSLFAQFLTPEDSMRIPVPAAAAQSTPVTTPSTAPEPRVTTAHDNSIFTDFAAYGREKNVILSWHLAHGREIEKRIQIYRFQDEPRVIHDISRGTLIAKMSGEINIYEDVPPVRGVYYYAIFVESTQGLEPGGFTASRNLVGPVSFQSQGSQSIQTQKPVENYARPNFESQEIQGPDPEEKPEPERPTHSDDRGINHVIRKTFLKGNYSGAVRDLKPFFRNRSPKVRAKAIFYTGLARYRLEQYDRAIKYFEHPLAAKYYRRNADFWIKRTLENLR